MKAEVFNRFLKEMQVKSFDLLGTKSLVDALNYTLLTAACIKEMLDEEKAKGSVTN